MTLIPLTVGTHNQMDEINRLMLEQNKVNAQWREENLATTTDPSNRGEFIHPSMIQEDPNYWPVWLQNPAAGAYLTGFGWLGSWLSRNNSLLERGYREWYPTTPTFNKYENRFETPDNEGGTYSKTKFFDYGGSYPYYPGKYNYQGDPTTHKDDFNRPMKVYKAQKDYYNYLQKIFPPGQYPEGPPDWFLDEPLQGGEHHYTLSTPQYVGEKMTPLQNFFYGQKYPEYRSDVGAFYQDMEGEWVYGTDGLGLDYPKSTYEKNRLEYENMLYFYPPFEQGFTYEDVKWGEGGLDTKTVMKNMPVGNPTEHVMGPTDEQWDYFTKLYNEGGKPFLDEALSKNLINKDMYDSLLSNLNSGNYQGPIDLTPFLTKVDSANLPIESGAYSDAEPEPGSAEYKTQYTNEITSGENPLQEAADNYEIVDVDDGLERQVDNFPISGTTEEEWKEHLKNRKTKEESIEARHGHPNPNFTYPEGYEEGTRDYPDFSTWDEKQILQIQHELSNKFGFPVTIDGFLGDKTMQYLSVADPDLADALESSQFFENSYRGENIAYYDTYSSQNNDNLANQDPIPPPPEKPFIPIDTEPDDNEFEEITVDEIDFDEFADWESPPPGTGVSTEPDPDPLTTPFAFPTPDPIPDADKNDYFADLGARPEFDETLNLEEYKRTVFAEEKKSNRLLAAAVSNFGQTLTSGLDTQEDTTLSNTYDRLRQKYSSMSKTGSSIRGFYG